MKVFPSKSVKCLGRPGYRRWLEAHVAPPLRRGPGPAHRVSRAARRHLLLQIKLSGRGATSRISVPSAVGFAGRAQLRCARGHSYSLGLPGESATSWTRPHSEVGALPSAALAGAEATIPLTETDSVRVICCAGDSQLDQLPALCRWTWGHVAVGSLVLEKTRPCTPRLALAFPGEATCPVWWRFLGAQRVAGAS